MRTAVAVVGGISSNGATASRLPQAQLDAKSKLQGRPPLPSRIRGVSATRRRSGRCRCGIGPRLPPPLRRSNGVLLRTTLGGGGRRTLRSIACRPAAWPFRSLPYRHVLASKNQRRKQWHRQFRTATVCCFLHAAASAADRPNTLTERAAACSMSDTCAGHARAHTYTHRHTDTHTHTHTHTHTSSIAPPQGRRI